MEKIIFLSSPKPMLKKYNSSIINTTFPPQIYIVFEIISMSFYPLIRTIIYFKAIINPFERKIVEQIQEGEFTQILIPFLLCSGSLKKMAPVHLGYGVEALLAFKSSKKS